MAKLSRVFLALFGGTGPVDDFEKFGSQVDGGSVKTKNVADIQTLSAWNNGWKDAILSANRAPFLEDMNAVMYVHAYETCYLLQEGIPEYDSNTNYFIGSIVKKPSTSELYASLTDNNAGNPLPSQTDNANWHFLSTGVLQAGNTAGRPATPVTGFIYINTEVHQMQRFNGATYDGISLVPDASITGTQIATSVAGSGLSGGGGAALSVNVDGSTIDISADTLRVKPGGITPTQLLDGIATGYRRPTLSYNSATTVDVEAQTGTANQTAIRFPDGEQRSVTENLGSTQKYRRFDITKTAQFTSGTESGGLRSGLSQTINTWYALYAVKSQINAANFVIVGDTTTPTQANFATLNSRYGANSWLYLGMIRNGNNFVADNEIVSFYMAGNETLLGFTTNNVVFPGVRHGTGGAGATLYTHSDGVGNLDIPFHLSLVTFKVAAGSNAYLALTIIDTVTFGGTADGMFLTAPAIPSLRSAAVVEISPRVNVTLQAISTGTAFAQLVKFKDPVLSGGLNNAI